MDRYLKIFSNPAAINRAIWCFIIMFFCYLVIVYQHDFQPVQIIYSR